MILDRCSERVGTVGLTRHEHQADHRPHQTTEFARCGVRAERLGRAVVALTVLAMAVACSSNDSTAASPVTVTVRAGLLPPGTRQLVGEGRPFGQAATRQALHASDRVLLGQASPTTEGAGPPFVLRSVDEGRSWRRTHLPGLAGASERTLWAGGGRAAVLAVEAVRPFDGGTAVVRTSNDAGRTWRDAIVPDPNGSERLIGTGRWWKGRWIFMGTAERGDGPAAYAAIWESRDGVHLNFSPGVLPGAVAHVLRHQLTVIGDTLIATGISTSGDPQTWRTVDGVHWVLLEPGLAAFAAGPLVKQGGVSFDAGRTWQPTGTIGRPDGLADASRVGSTWWFVEQVRTGEHTVVQRLVQTDDRGRHFRRVALPQRPRRCRSSPSPDEVLDPPRKVGRMLAVVSSCTPSEDQFGATGPTDIQLRLSRDDGHHWFTQPLPISARTGTPVAVSVHGDHLTVVIQRHRTGRALAVASITVRA
jgi:hypothetical protein